MTVLAHEMQSPYGPEPSSTSQLPPCLVLFAVVSETPCFKNIVSSMVPHGIAETSRLFLTRIRIERVHVVTAQIPIFPCGNLAVGEYYLFNVTVPRRIERETFH